MSLKLVRVLTNGATPGTLFLDHMELCRTLELPWLNNKPHVSCVPALKYRMVYVHSPKFKMKKWRLVDVPDRSGVLWHVASYVRQLEGCIAPCLSHADMDGDGKIDGVNSGKATALFEEAMMPYREIGHDLEIVWL